ncbi:MAG: Folylpolyglutamate synthetase [Trizodia sp. TS-e1964]|nr:MAG: Folylpolyglutamate synthetase [Trizodia sp. TS-e1964]
MRDYKAAIAALNTLQSNFSSIEAARKSGALNVNVIQETVEWLRRIGYRPSQLSALNPIHIAGTKGKGSTSAFISSILSQYTPNAPLHKIGLYTSPHLRFVRERIQIQNEPLSEPLFARYFFQVWDALEAASLTTPHPAYLPPKPAYFRFLTLVAFHTFMKEGVDTAVFEAGIGGEYDCTNILEAPTVTGITSLGIDHVNLLGNTIDKIAWHKAGIFKPGTPAFTAPQPAQALKVLQQRASAKGVSLTIVPPHPELNSIKLGLAGAIQKTNASLAVAICASHLRHLGHAALPTQAPLPPEFRRGLERARLGGRCETRHEACIEWSIDGGHTLDSITLAAQWYATKACPPGAQRVLIFNQQTRDAAALVRALHATLREALGQQRPFARVLFCPNVTFRGAGYAPDLVSVNVSAASVDDLSVQKGLAEAWKAVERGAGGEETRVSVVRTIEEAVESVREVAAREGEVMALVTGSLHLVGGFLEVMDWRK